MAKNKFFGIYDLQMFAEGGAGAAGAGAEGGTSADASGVTAAAAGQRKGVKNPLADVVYGKQPDAAEGTQAAAATPDVPDVRRARYDAFRKEFKAELDADTQKIVQNRLKSSKETTEKYNKLQPVLGMLGQKYGADPEDLDALTKAIEDDDSYYEQEALEKGISVQDLKQIKRMERENAELKRQMDAVNQQKQIEADLARWMGEAEEAAKVFPGLDLGTELQNPQFFGLLKDGVDLQTAYFAIHHRELVPQMMQYTAAKTQQQVAQGIQSGSARPAENAISGNSTAVVKSDVSQLSKADRAEIIRRVQRGERIVF